MKPRPDVLVAILACLPLPLAAQQQTRRALPEIVPDSAYAVATFGGLARCRQEAAHAGPFRLASTMLERAGIGEPFELLAPHLAPVTGQINRALQHVGLDAADVRVLLSGPLAIGFGRPSLYSGGTVSTLFAFDVRGHEQRAAEILERLQRHLDSAAGANLERSSRAVAGVTIHRVDLQEAGIAFSRALVDGYLLVGTGDGFVSECVRTIRGEVRSLAENPAYAKGLAQLGGGEPLFSIFVNGQPVGEALAPFLPYESAAIGTALGVDGFDGAYWGSMVGAAGPLDALFLGLPGDPKGVVKALASEPSKLSAARYCRTDSVVFATLSADWPAFIDSCGRLVALLPDNIRAQLVRDLSRELRRELGVDLRDLARFAGQLHELLTALGSEVSVCVTLPLQHGVLPELLVFAELRQPQDFERELTARLQKLLGPRYGQNLRHREHAGRTLHFVTSLETIVLSPAFTVDGSTLIISPLRTTLEGALARADAGAGSLADAAAFRRASERAGPAAMFCRIALPVVARSVWPVLRPHVHAGLELAASGFAPNGLAYDTVPTADEVAAALGDYFVSAVAGPDGVTLKEQQPVNFAAMLAAGGVAVDALLQACERAGEVGQRGAKRDPHSRL